MNRAWLEGLAANTSRLIFHLLHEMSHASRLAWDHRGTASYEAIIKGVAASIMKQIASPLPSTYTTTHREVFYYPNNPTT